MTPLWWYVQQEFHKARSADLPEGSHSQEDRHRKESDGWNRMDLTVLLHETVRGPPCGVPSLREHNPSIGSPLLSNIVLDEFDRELERRGLWFARYGTAQCLLRFARDTEIDWRPIAQPAEPPGTDPYTGWCDRESGRPPTYVDGVPSMFDSSGVKVPIAPG